MLAFLKTYITYGNRFCAIEHCSKGDTSHFYTTVLKQTKKEVLKVSDATSPNLETALSTLKTNWPIVVIINNDNVLTKSIHVETEQNDGTSLINTAFPNINTEDFYYNIIKGTSSYTISICRKSFVDSILQEYTVLKFRVVNFYLGNLPAAGVTAYLENNDLYTSNAKISILNHQISEINTTESLVNNSYNINGIEIGSNYILSFSGALSPILGTPIHLTNTSNASENLLSSFKNTRFYNTFLKGGLIFILLVLLGNFLFFNFYFENVKTLEDTAQLNKKAKQDIILLKEQVEKSQKLTEDILKNNASKSSFYVNTIVHSMPSTLLLSEINYQPLQTRIKKEKPIVLDQNSIVISGVSNDSDAFSKWINTLETITWVNHVEVFRYSDASKKKSDFSLKLYVNHD